MSEFLNPAVEMYMLAHEKRLCCLLKDLQEELEKQESSLRRFGAVTHQLLRECHPSVSDSLNNALKDINAR